MNDIHDFAPDVVNTLENKSLESAIRAVLYSPSHNNLQGFFRTFVSSTILVLTQGAPIAPANEILQRDEEGFAYYSKDTKINLVQFYSQLEGYILPVFTKSAHVHRINGLNAYHGLAIPAVSLLEMILVANSSKIIFNPESPEALEIGREPIEALVEELRLANFLPKEANLLNASL